MEKDFLVFAAEVFEDKLENMTLDLMYDTYEKWDSMAHLRLIMETEEKYDIEIPFDKVAEIKTLRQLYEMIKREKE